MKKKMIYIYNNKEKIQKVMIIQIIFKVIIISIKLKINYKKQNNIHKVQVWNYIEII